MRLYRRLTGLLLCLTWLAAGCAAPGALISEQLAGQFPRMGKAPADGNYGLFIDGQSDPAFTISLKEGDRLGFDRVPAGTVGDLKIEKLDAIAGPQLFPIDAAKSYQWRKL